MRLCYLLLALFVATTLPAQYEADYIAALAKALNGQTEVRVENGRVDILTDQYAIEVERASHWKNSIGQALWYAQQTNRQAGIIILLESSEDYKHFIRLNSTLAYSGLTDKIRVWLYPNDFPAIAPASPSTYGSSSMPKSAATGYWLTKSSGKRHRSSCRWYEKSNGRYCTVDEGVAAGCCH